MAFGPHNGGQGLYYTTYADGGQVRRVAHTGNGNNDDNNNNDDNGTITIDDESSTDDTGSTSDDGVNTTTDDGDSTTDEGEGGTLAESGTDPDELSSESGPRGDVVDEIPPTALPETGGLPILGLAALASLLLSGGVLALSWRLWDRRL